MSDDLEATDAQKPSFSWAASDKEAADLLGKAIMKRLEETIEFADEPPSEATEPDVAAEEPKSETWRDRKPML
jgi:hypothetical protein